MLFDSWNEPDVTRVLCEEEEDEDSGKEYASFLLRCFIGTFL